MTMLIQAQAFAALFPDVALFPVVGKVALIKWAGLGAGVHGSDEEWRPATGYAVAPRGNSGLICLDIDESAILPDVYQAAPALLSSLHVRRGDHLHVYARLPRAVGRATLSLPSLYRPGHEAASLRGAGAYWIGPGSRHEAGDIYEADGRPVVKLEFLAVGRLLDLFSSNGPGALAAQALKGQVATHAKHEAERPLNPKLLEAISVALAAKGYRKHTDLAGHVWLKGKCPNKHLHKHDDRHSSFVFNTSTGYGWCFACHTSFNTKEVARWLDIDPAVYGRLYEAGAGPARQLHPRSELIKSKQTVAARILDLLPSATFSRKDALAATTPYGWPAIKTDRALAAACRAGLLARVQQGQYELTQAGADYRATTTRLARDTYQGRAAKYRRAHTLKIELDHQAERPKSADLAQAIGVSRATLYRHENALHIPRVPLFERREFRTAPESGYCWIEAIRPGQPLTPVKGQAHGETFVLSQQFDGSLDAGQAFQAAIQAGATKLLRCRQLPSLRLLPGQRLQDLVPEGGRLEGRAIYHDYFAWPDEFTGARRERTIMPNSDPNSDSDLKYTRSVSQMTKAVPEGSPKGGVSKVTKQAKNSATVPCETASANAHYRNKTRTKRKD